MSGPCKLRYLRYLFASMLGSLFTVFVMSMREAALYGHLTAQVQAQAHFRSGGLGTSAMRTPLSHNDPWSSERMAEEGCHVRAQVPRMRAGGAWQVYIEGGRELMVYGAYYDDRKGVGSPAMVRVFGVSSAPKTVAVFCQLWYADSKSNSNNKGANKKSNTSSENQKLSNYKIQINNKDKNNNYVMKNGVKYSNTRHLNNNDHNTNTSDNNSNNNNNYNNNNTNSYKGNPVVTMAILTIPGRGYRNVKKILYQEYLFSCPLSRNDSLPVSISLAFHPCQNSTINTQIVYAQKLPRKENRVAFGVCVAAAYGDIPPRRLAEWAELLTILGVREINIYITKVTNRTERAFWYYQQKGVMVVRQAPSPLLDTSYWAGKLAVIPAFNDCVYRNMYRYNYTMIIDFDEIIVPHMHSNYSAMMADLRTFHSRLKVVPGLLLFRNAYFFLDMGATVNITNANNNMTVMAHTRRVDISPRSYSAKSIFDPRICIIAWNHFCLLRLPRTPVLNVDPLYALSHHYKKCHFRRDECQEMMSRNVTDTAILKFKVALRRRLKKVHIT